MSKPRLAVVGLGRYYRKLERGIAECFTTVLKADAADVGSEEGALRSLAVRSAPDAIMLLTPNHLHARHILELADLRIPILVEKPLVTSEPDLDLVLQSLDTNPSLYCSDFYLDVRAAPLLAWFKRPYPSCLGKCIQVEEDEHNLWQQGSSVLGSIRRVEAVLLEGEGQAGSFEGREWLWDPVHGGVLWDLAYHFVVLWHGLFGESLSLVSTDARTIPHSLGRPAAETYAALELRASSGTHFIIRVGKYHERGNERWFRIEGSHGQAQMVFQDPNILMIRVQEGECVALLAGSYYTHVVEAFKEYVETGASQPHGLEPAVAATRLIAAIKQQLNLAQVSAHK
ncbi:MAG: Gfo/Idh/MocA family oxidoreductase [Acidobacteriia bacterium]|nr:Gfo/Idh/MocA family oxidoreductase [Terriglobia bacterium]